MHVLHKFFGFNKHNSFLFGPIQPQFPTTKELHVLGKSYQERLYLCRQWAMAVTIRNRRYLFVPLLLYLESSFSVSPDHHQGTYYVARLGCYPVLKCVAFDQAKELLSRRRWRLVSALLSNKFGYCLSGTVFIFGILQKHNSLSLGPI